MPTQVPIGRAVLDERQVIFGSLVVSRWVGACPGDCFDGEYPLLCACLTCARGRAWSCVGNMALPAGELDAMFRVNPSDCVVRRHLSESHLRLYGALEVVGRGVVARPSLEPRRHTHQLGD